MATQSVSNQQPGLVQPSFTTVKETTRECSSTDSKTHGLVVLGHLLECAAVASMIAVFSLAFSHVVVVLCALPFCVVMLSIGGALKKAYLLPQGAYGPANLGPPAPRIAGQPVPLSNSEQNCWLSAAMQCIVHIDVLREKALEFNDPVLTQWITKYQELQASATPVLPMNMEQIRPVFGQRGTEDTTVVFNKLLGEKPLYEFRQRKFRQTSELGDVPYDESLILPKPFIQLEPRKPDRLDIQSLFSHFFSYAVGGGDHMTQKFVTTLPNTLAVKVNRYYGNQLLMDPVQKIDHVFRFGSAHVDSENGVQPALPAEYLTDAFIVYDAGQMRGFSGLKGGGGEPSRLGGHYYACVFKEGKWWICNDHTISEITEERALDLMNYSCFFFANRRLPVSQ